MKCPVTISVNGSTYQRDVEPRLLLVHFLRDAGLTGTKIGCDTSQCGACTVLLDGVAVKSCTVLAVQADGASVTTIEGLARGRPAHGAAGGVLGEARAAVRLLHAGDGLRRPGNPAARTRIRRPSRSGTGSKGNMCRCTGYQNIVRAVQAAAADPRVGRNRRCADDAPHTAAPARVFGSGIRRREDPRLLTGTARYTADFTLPGHGARRGSAQSARPCPDSRHRYQPRQARAGRGRRVHRRRHRSRPEVHSLRVAPAECRAEHRALPRHRHRRRPLRRRCRRRGRRRIGLSGVRRARADRRRLRAAAGRGRSASRPPRTARRSCTRKRRATWPFTGRSKAATSTPRSSRPTSSSAIASSSSG